MKHIFTLLALIIVQFSFAQKLEDAQFLSSLSAQQITGLLGTPVVYGVDMYKVRYYTADEKGQDHIASGLVCIPQNETMKFPLVCYQHGTVGSREEVPSRLSGGYQLALALSAFGYVSCAADFVGLGDSPGSHLYVHAETEASAGVDLLLAVRELSVNENFPPFHLNDQLFLGGYSQGGHASMAAHRLAEQEYSDIFDVVAAAHMSGPYSISEKMIEFTLGDSEYGTVSYVPNASISYLRAYPELFEGKALSDFFKSAYIEDILLFRDEQITLWELNNRLTQTLLDSVGGVFPREMLQDSLLNSILTDPLHPFSLALADNDVYDWTPQARTNLYYCEGDEQVTFENAILAESVMKANGAPFVNALRMDATFPLSHTQCISPVVTSVIFFFGAYQEISTSISEIVFDKEIRIISGAGQIIFDIPSSKYSKDLLMQIHSLDGRKQSEASIVPSYSLYDISQLNSGMYVVNLYNNNLMVKSQKIVIP